MKKKTKTSVAFARSDRSMKLTNDKIPTCNIG